MAKVENEEKLQEETTSGVEELNNKEKELNEKLSKVKDELEDIKDRHTRLIAEFDNLKKRSAKEREGLYNSIMSDVISSFLPVIDNLEEEWEKLDQNNNNLIDFIKHILEMLKDFFRRILLSKNEVDKNKTINILKECYEKDLYKASDLIDVSKDTDKEMEVNNFIKEETLEKEYDYFD